MWKNNGQMSEERGKDGRNSSEVLSVNSLILEKYYEVGPLCSLNGDL